MRTGPNKLPDDVEDALERQGMRAEPFGDRDLFNVIHDGRVHQQGTEAEIVAVLVGLDTTRPGYCRREIDGTAYTISWGYADAIGPRRLRLHVQTDTGERSRNVWITDHGELDRLASLAGLPGREWPACEVSP